MSTTIGEAADQLADRLREGVAYNTFSIGIAEPDTIFVYRHHQTIQPKIDLSNGWMGFKVVVRFVGEIKPAGESR